MLFVLEALKEAAVRTPGAMGQTMSIVGGLVLGTRQFPRDLPPHRPLS